MSYQEEVAKVVAAHSDQLNTDLADALRAADRAKTQLTEAEDAPDRIKTLLLFERDAGGSGANYKTLHKAMEDVLRGGPTKGMRAADIAAEVDRRHLYRMRDGRPVEPQQIHARAGNYPQLFVRRGVNIAIVEKHDKDSEE